MMRRSRLRRPATVLFCLALLLAALPAPRAAADGTVDGAIGNPYGAPRAVDADNDAACPNTEDRGDLIDFHAFNDSSNRWNFAFVIDSAAALDTSVRVDYWIPIDVGANNGPQLYFNSAPNWGRQFGVTGDYFIRCESNGPSSLACSLFNPGGGDTGAAITASASTVIGGRRYVELRLDSDAGTGVNTNNAIGTMVISGYDPRTASSPYYSIDAAGGNNPEGMTGDCSGQYVYRDYTDNNLITAANCNTAGRPTDSGANNNRQCLSLPARTTTAALTDIAACSAANAGVIVNGATAGDNYTLLTEASFAGPYQGGSSSASDFTGESASYQTCNASGACTAITGADIANVYARGDAYFLYLFVSGNLGSFGGSAGGSDLANLFLPIDLPDITSGSAEATTTGVPNTAEFPNAPGGRYVNFKGWDVDYVVELIWQGNIGDTNAAKLYDYTGARTWTSSSFTVMSAKDTGDHTNQTPPTAAALYYGRTGDDYEFAIPWAALGYAAWTGGSGAALPTCAGQCRPTANAAIRLGAYTTADSNAVSGEDNWDVYDQAPGIGQGGNGLGSHERVGDEWLDTDDNRTTAGEYDGSPYSGATRGTPDKSSSDPDGADVDTIESYFRFKLAPADRDCIASGTPLAVTLASLNAVAQTAAVEVTWDTVSEVGNAGFNLYRAASPDGPGIQLNGSLIPSQGPGSQTGYSYRYLDAADLVPGTTYTYWLEDVALTGGTARHAPISVLFSGSPTALRLGRLRATAAAPLALAFAAAGILLAGAALRRRRG